ncbi:hypothetical protein L218DRAFT_963724 [Marasmius fiardii PR-910]|nr:hypothetical protein L218DRAFT_963718 [Marasmius fiardii PR-910]KAF9259286.1 hypothetical protein L218DRAFT_963724 [Marasmius fiardii PR-910]
MSFFPNDHPHEPRSSAGITALARPASKIDADFSEVDPKWYEFEELGPLSSHGGLFEKLPLELIGMISDFCSHDFLHLRKFSGISTRTRDAALNASVRYIYINSFRLVKAIDTTGVRTGFEKEMFEENEACSGLFSLETAQNRPALCVVGYEGDRGDRDYHYNPSFGINALVPANEMCSGLFSLEGKQITRRSCSWL